ncbi:hypothetical protein DYB31_016249 [Aphanomyces astaci]|uniref:DUF6818 domain-containing protein n=1 Tax=Aphanomyces astaci TaxID=112090 RepID=A0A397F1T8_APHAT|nr:hypothetical protein DYB31_016249 [Aphanomyces astaci]
MLDCVQSLLPLGQHGWAKVAQLFNANQSVVFARDWEACKRKFTFLKAHKKPTGDPNCPPLVARAKRLQRELDCCAVVETMDDNSENNQHEGVSDDEIRMTAPDAIAHHGPYMPRSTVSSVEQTAMDDDDVSNVFANDEEGCDGDEEPPVTKRPRRLNPIQAEPPNRSGLSHDTLRLLGKRLIVEKFLNPPPLISSSASSMSFVARRRRSLDTLIEQAHNEQPAGNDIPSLVVMLEERAQKRQEERDSREQQREDERQRLRDEPEERDYQRQIVREEREERLRREEHERDQNQRREDNENRVRQEQFQMAMMMKLFGENSKRQE